MDEGNPSLAHRLLAVESRLASIEARLAKIEEDEQGWVAVEEGDVVPVLKIGSQIRIRRTALGLNQTETAERIGVDQSTIAKWERGTRMSANHLPTIAAFLGSDINELRYDYLVQFSRP